MVFIFTIQQDMSYTGLIANANGQCLSAPNKNGEQMTVGACDEANPKQIITIKDRQMFTKFRNDNSGQIDTWKGTVAWSGECGSGNDCDFRFDPMDAKYPDVSQGTFKFYGWGRQGGHDASVDPRNNTITQNLAQDGTPAAIWMPHDMLKKCAAYGIPANRCDPTSLADCTAWENFRNPACQPTACAQSNGSFLEHQQCRDWCVSNPGKCDAAAVSYCAAHPDNTTFCGCYNLSAYQNIINQFQANGTPAFNPYCNVTDCSAPGSYKTSIYAGTQCNQQVCIQNLALDVDASKLGGINMSCVNSEGSSPRATDSPTSTASSSTEKKTKIIGISVGLVLAFLMLIGVAVAMFVK